MERKADVREHNNGLFGGNFAIIAVGIAAVAYVGVLLVLNYRSDSQLRVTTIQKLRTETETLAESMGYFFEERKNDLINLGISREVAVFFENRDLGMSVEYGLNLSLPPIAEGFKRLMKRKKFAGEPVYIRMALIDKSGKLLVDSAAEQPDPQLMPQYIDTTIRDGQVQFRSGGSEPVVSLAYYFKGFYAGQLVAWLRPKVIDVQLLGGTVKGKDVIWLTEPAAAGSKILAPQHLATTFHKNFNLSSISLPKPKTIMRFTAPNAQGESTDWLCIVAAVRGNNVRIVRIIQAENEFESFTSRWHLAGMATLAVMILCGAVFVFALNIRSKLLHVRLEESLHRESEIQSKERELSKANEKLTSEIAIRKALSEKLAHSHVELEQRVEKRTAELQHSLQEKNMLIREVHHRVKNNLQVMSSLLNLQSLQTKNAEVVDVLQKTKNRVYSMAMLHEALYLSENLARIKLPDYIERLTSHLMNSMENSNSNIVIKRCIAEIYLQIEQALPCGLIINELITNAMKHAFPADRPGCIMLIIEVQADGSISMVISDDGVGLPPDFDIQTINSLGLKLVHMLTNQLGGELIIRQHNGTKFQITFSAAD